MGDVAAAMDHLRLALDEPPEPTFRPVLRALRLHAVEAGSSWTALDLLDVERGGGRTRRRARRPGRREGLPARAPAGRAGRPARCWRRRWRWSTGPRGGPAGARGERAACAGRATPRCCSRCSSGGWRRRARRASAGGCSAGWRCSPRRDPARAAEALGLWLARARRGGGARAPRRWRGPGPGGWRRRWGKFAELARVVALEADASAGRRAGRLAGAGGGAGPPPAGRAGARRRADRGGAGRRSRRSGAALRARPSNALAAGQWKKARDGARPPGRALARSRLGGDAVGPRAPTSPSCTRATTTRRPARYRRLLEARPGDPVALAALERIASRTGDAPAQVSAGRGGRRSQRRSGRARRAGDARRRAGRDGGARSAARGGAGAAGPRGGARLRAGGAPARAAVRRRSGAGTRWPRSST